MICDAIPFSRGSWGFCMNRFHQQDRRGETGRQLVPCVLTAFSVFVNQTDPMSIMVKQCPSYVQEYK
jgi:hypothetical protein